DVETGRELRKLEGMTTNDLRGLCFSPDGKTVAATGNKFAGGFAHEVRAWDATTGKERWHAEKPQTSAQALAYSPDGKFLAELQANGTVTLYDDIGKEAHSFGSAFTRVGPGGVMVSTSAGTITFAPDGRTLVVTGYDFEAKEARLRVYELATGKVR